MLSQIALLCGLHLRCTYLTTLSRFSTSNPIITSYGIPLPTTLIYHTISFIRYVPCPTSVPNAASAESDCYVGILRRIGPASLVKIASIIISPTISIPAKQITDSLFIYFFRRAHESRTSAFGLRNKCRDSLFPLFEPPKRRASVLPMSIL